MGTDLRLLPFDHDGGDWAYSHTILNVTRSYDLFDEIAKAPRLPAPYEFATFVSYRDDIKERAYGATTHDAYGDRITYTTAERLCALSGHPEVQDSTKNRATWAYLAQLPPETKVALFWH